MGTTPSPIVTFLTDFGSADEYVGVMKGEVLRRCREAILVDLSHEIDPGDVLRGALVLAAAVPHFPAGTIHVAVVDPGVGSTRKGLVVDCGNHLLVGPDNGLLSQAIPSDAQAYILDQPEFFASQIISTFHGRDIFAPVAGHLATGRLLSELGTPTSEVCRLELPAPLLVDDGVAGQVLYSDRFGNLVTNIERAQIESCGGGLTVAVGDVDIGLLRETYCDGDPGALIAMIGSTDRLEVAVVDGSAAARFGPRGARGTRVLVNLGSGQSTRPQRSK